MQDMLDALERLWRRLLHVVGRGRITLVLDDGPVQLLQARLNAAALRDEVPRLGEYGLCSVPPAGADVVVVCIGGNATDMVAIATGHQTYRLRSLGAGEVALHDDKGQTIELRASGLVVNAPLGLTINAPMGMTVHGNTVFDGTVTANGKRIDETHRHVGVVSGGATSGIVS